MALNPNIALSGQTPDIGGGIMRLAAVKQQKEDRAIQHQQMQKQGQLTDLQIQSGERQGQLQDMQLDRARLEEDILYASQVAPLLDKGDIEGARGVLQQQLKTSKGENQNDIREALQALDTNPQALTQATRQLVDLGMQMGVMQRPEVDKGTVVAEGGMLVDAGGNVIADNRRAQQPLTDAGKARADYQAGRITYDDLRTIITPQMNPPSGFRFTEQGNLEPIPGGPKDIDVTPAQQAVDREFAKEYTQFAAAGGYADIEKQMAQLQEVSSMLGTENLTGPILGRTPDWLKQTFGYGKAIEARDAVEEVVQRNLRLILGAQFTEREGDRLIARAYNPRLPESENKKRVDALIRQISTAAEAKASASRYYEENGTLSGWQGNLPSLGDMYQAIDDSGSMASDPLGIRSND
jgi:hypothetical protein